MRSSRRFRRLGTQGRSTSFLLAAYSGGPLWQIAHPPQGLTILAARVNGRGP